MIRLGNIRIPTSGNTLEAPIYSTNLDCFESLGLFQLPTSRSVLFLATDAAGVAVDPIYIAAERLLDSGLVYLCAWGADCERVHDIFDDAYVGDGSCKRELDCMTTWHSDESLADAVDYFLTCARPEEEGSGAIAYVAVSIGDQELGNQVAELIVAADEFVSI